MGTLNTIEPQAASQGVPSRARSSYIPSLDGLRAIAFLFVFGAHATANTISRFLPASFGVTVFFFLSGFLITTLLRNELADTGTISIKDFYIRRSLRIFIPLYLSYAIAAVLSKYLLHGNAGSLSGALSVFFYYFNYARMVDPTVVTPPGLDVAWSLSVEEHFYLLFPLLYLTFHRLRLSARSQVLALIAFCALCLSWRTYVFFHHFPVYWTYYSTDTRFESILLGCLLAIWTNPTLDAPTAFLKRFSGLAALLSLVVLIVTMATRSFAFRETIRYTIQGACLYFIFYYAISSSHRRSVRWLANPALRYVGWLSYSMYLIHVFILDNLKAHLPPWDWLLALLTFSLAFGYALLVRQLVEKPLQRLRARFRHSAPPINAAGVEGI